MFAKLKRLKKLLDESEKVVELDSDLEPLSIKKPTVLVIDDDSAMLQVLRLVLYEAGFEVVTSISGTKGVTALRYAPKSFDAVLLDYNMPGFNGEQTLPYVRQLAPHAKIVCVSGMEAKDLPPAVQNGVDLIVHKPFTFSELVDSLRKLLGSLPAATTTNPCPAC